MKKIIFFLIFSFCLIVFVSAGIQMIDRPVPKNDAFNVMIDMKYLGWATGDSSADTDADGLLDKRMLDGSGTLRFTWADAEITNATNWNTAYGWGDWSTTVGKITDDTTNFKTAYDSVSAWDNRGYPQASTSLLGISSFSSTNFTVSSGAVSLTAQTISKTQIDTTASNFVFDDAYHVTSAVADSEYSTLGYVKAYSQPVEATLTDIADGTIAENLVNTANPWAVNEGGTGAATFTDGGVMIGNGTGALQVTAVMTNGQLLIGDGTTDPTVGTLTEGEGIDITNGAGTITLAGEDASTTNKGIASFNASDFSVSSGAVSKIHYLQATFALPKNLYDSLAVWTFYTFPSAATIDSLFIETNNSSSYSVIFEEWSLPQTKTNDIDTIATSSSYLAGGVPSDASIAAGSRIKIRLPATTGTKELSVRVKYHY